MVMSRLPSPNAGEFHKNLAAIEALTSIDLSHFRCQLGLPKGGAKIIGIRLTCLKACDKHPAEIMVEGESMLEVTLLLVAELAKHGP